MNTKDEPLITTIARQCARYSLIIGTLIFMLFAITGLEFFVITGFIFVLSCIAINELTLLILLLYLINTPQHAEKIIRSILLILLNIPIAILFGWLTTQIHQLLPLKL